MKSKFLTIAILIMAFTFSSFAQTDKEIDAIVKDIKAKYADVNKNVKKATKKSYSSNDMDDYSDFSFDIYRINNQIIKIVHFWHSPGDCGGSYEYYFNDNKLFFCFMTTGCDVGDMSSLYEQRCYFNNDKMIKYLNKDLVKKKEKNIKPGNDEFKSTESEIFNKYDELKGYFNKST